MLLNYNNQFINHYPSQSDLGRNQAVSYSYVIQHENPNPIINQIKKSESNQIEQDKNSSINDDDQGEDTQFDDICTPENDEDHLYVTIDLPSQAVNKLKNLSLDQMNQIKQLGILGIQFEDDNSLIKLDSYGSCNGSSDESQSKKRSRKTVMELTANTSQELEPKAKKQKCKEIDSDQFNESMSEDLKNIYQIRQMLSQQAQKEDEVEKLDQSEKTKKPRQRAPPDPNKPKAKRSTKPKNENSNQESHSNNQPVAPQVHSQPPVRINQLIQQNAYINQNLSQSIYQQQTQSPQPTQLQQPQFNHYTNSQEQMKIRNILFYNSNSSVPDNQSNGFMDQQKLSNTNFLILNSNINSTSDCNSNSNMTSNSDLSLTNSSYGMNGNNNQINFLNI